MELSKGYPRYRLSARIRTVCGETFSMATVKWHTGARRGGPCRVGPPFVKRFGPKICTTIKPEMNLVIGFAGCLVGFARALFPMRRNRYQTRSRCRTWAQHEGARGATKLSPTWLAAGCPLAICWLRPQTTLSSVAYKLPATQTAKPIS